MHYAGMGVIVGSLWFWLLGALLLLVLAWYVQHMAGCTTQSRRCVPYYKDPSATIKEVAG